MLCSEHQRLTDWPLFRQSATRWLHSMRLCRAFAPRIVTLSISISSSPCDSLAVEGITSDNLQRLPQTRIDSMVVYESPLHSLMAGELFQSGLIFDAYASLSFIALSSSTMALAFSLDAFLLSCAWIALSILATCLTLDFGTTLNTLR